MRLCVETVKDPEVDRITPAYEGTAGGHAGPEPETAEREENWGGLARWFGFNRSGTGKIPNIVHVNLKCFFASVEQVLNPKLRKKPVLVGPGIVASASYEAKLCGVKTGMTFPTALRVCPTAILAPGAYDLYAEFAERVRGILESYTPAVEVGSHDDFYLNFGGSARRYSDYPGTLRRMQREILGRTGLGVAIGAGRTKVVAATASGLQPPPGLRVVAAGEEETFLTPLPPEQIHGIGRVHGATLAKHGVATIGELRQVPKPALQSVFGEFIGKQIWERARGLDGTNLPERLSSEVISRAISIEESGLESEFFTNVIRYLGTRVSAALRESGKQAHAVGLRVRYVDDFSAYESMRVDPTRDERDILAGANSLFSALCTRSVPVSLIGVTATCFDVCQSPPERESKDSARGPYPGRVDSLSGDYGWNVSRAFG